MSDHAKSPGTRRVNAQRILAGRSLADAANVVEEIAIALVYNGVSHAVMMATANDLEDFALGFSLGEGIVAAAQELEYIEALERQAGIVIEMRIPQSRCDALQSRQRRTVGASACGLCGSESLEAALRPVPGVAMQVPVAVERISAMLRELDAKQSMNQATGGAHAAAWCDGTGMLVREDVGRHCAFDKLVGALARQGNCTRDGFAIVSSRASYELVHKAASAGIGILVAISAPTSAAIELAESCGVCLIAFARGAQMNVYTHHTRLTGFSAA